MDAVRDALGKLGRNQGAKDGKQNGERDEALLTVHNLRIRSVTFGEHDVAEEVGVEIVNVFIRVA